MIWIVRFRKMFIDIYVKENEIIASDLSNMQKYFIVAFHGVNNTFLSFFTFIIINA